jgi:hypothetical protein
MDGCSSEPDRTAATTGGAASESGGQSGASGPGGSLTTGGVAAGGASAGGASGAAGAGEAGALGVGGGACLPEELAMLVAPCPLPAECSYSITDAGHLNVCYANGVKTLFVPRLGTSTTTVTSADGSTCYLLDSTQTSGLEPNRYDYVWMDRELTPVATGSLDANQNDVLIVKVSGIRYRIDLASEDCRGVSPLPLGTSRCEEGPCSS